MLRHIVRRPIYSRLFNIAKFFLSTRPRQTKVRNCGARVMRDAFLLGTFYDIIKPPEDLEQDFKRACDKSETAVTDLLMVIKKCIEEISRDYRNCIDKQIEITLTATELGPVGTHWDDMTRYRVQARELKQELESYHTLLKSITQMAQEQSLISFLTGVKDSPDNVGDRYAQLRKFVDDELQKNLKHERKLLNVNRDSILKSGKIKE